MTDYRAERLDAERHAPHDAPGFDAHDPDDVALHRRYVTEQQQQITRNAQASEQRHRLGLQHTCPDCGAGIGVECAGDFDWFEAMHADRLRVAREAWVAA